MANSNSVIIKFDSCAEFTVGNITKIVGLVEAKYLIYIIDILNLEANPRSSKEGTVTDAIQESILECPELFPFKTKGILLASSQYEHLERKRYRISPENLSLEGILDGGHNTLAIGLYILKSAFDYKNLSFPSKNKTWDTFKELWNENRSILDEYLKAEKESTDLDFLIPIELLVPKDPENLSCLHDFRNHLFEICEARNNNAELNRSDKANKKGYYDYLQTTLKKHNPTVCNRIMCKKNTGGDIKPENLIALTWIPLNLVTPISDKEKKNIEPISPNKLYSSKGSCLLQFERLMDSPEVTLGTNKNGKSTIIHNGVKSAFEVAALLPELHDYIYEKFPTLYNTAGGSYGRITAVKKMNEKRKIKRTPYTNKNIDTLSPDGFIMPLVYGLQALMKVEEINGSKIITWNQPPMDFLVNNLEKIVKYYSGFLSLCDYDPQKVGKSQQSYEQALSGFKMILAGIL